MNPSKKKGLGRGLTALFGDQKVGVKKEDKNKISQNRLKSDIADLSPNKYQPRVHFDEQKLDMKASPAPVGLIDFTLKLLKKCLLFLSK